MGEYPLKKDVATFQRFDKQVKRLLVNEDDITVQIIIDKYINKLMNKEIAIKYHYQPKYIVNKLARLFDKYC